MTSTSFILSPALKARATFPMAYRLYGQLYPDVPPGSQASPFSNHPYDPTPWFMGAWGLHSTFNDYAKLLQHLLQLGIEGREPDVSPPILSRESYTSLFVRTLSEKAKKDILRFKEDLPGRQGGLDWSTAWCVTDGDWKGMRRKGTGFCEFDPLFLLSLLLSLVDQSITTSFCISRGRSRPHRGLYRSDNRDRGESNVRRVSLSPFLPLTFSCLLITCNQMVGGTQLYHQGPETSVVWADLERAVYSGLE